MSDDSIDSRLKYLCIDQETRSDVVAVRDDIIKGIGPILDDFYRHVQTNPEAAEILKGKSLDGLKKAQTLHWSTLFSGTFDADYERKVTAIGNAHMRIGLRPSVYIGAYLFALNKIVDQFAKTSRRTDPVFVKRLKSVLKAVFLDMDLATSVYLSSGEKQRKDMLIEIANDLETEISSAISQVSAQGDGLQREVEALLKIAERLNDNSETVAAASEEATANVSTVAASSEELSHSINEIGNQIERAQNSVAEATQEASSASSIGESLASSTREITDILKLITDIASQTNLLALNATIEAARAGEAGKGFAVVAGEVKSLATQTQKATEEIREKVEAIQNRTNEMIASIAQINTGVGNVTATFSEIVTAVEEQRQATGEIAKNISEAAVGTQEVSRTIGQVASEATETQTVSQKIGSAVDAVGHANRDMENRVSNLMSSLRSQEEFDRRVKARRSRDEGAAGQERRDRSDRRKS
ncbi:chemotaxis protein [Rhodospirillaceae bacterium KN72]|uniref:Chemotaxis protein n=1 Tax=Pacificispira spongiicola TaxID=2729598 RepID=A0A7Y0DWW7_9PROT|nr:globin-coupled sensor protein [Pacificispira spongiicola]NMM42993.1 chemotaxis protein [Pacificispira spongiicola]